MNEKESAQREKIPLWAFSLKKTNRKYLIREPRFRASFSGMKVTIYTVYI